MKTYVLMISVIFPKTHPRAGERTYFEENISNKKIHTIRSNYEFWEKRINEINKGNAILSVRHWSGKPYNSKQIEIAQFKEIGLQKLIYNKNFTYAKINNTKIDLQNLANNDGLSFIDFNNWFKNYDRSKPMAIIHFTNFRY